MPEGPEVKLISENLNNKIKGCVLNEINIIGGRYKRKKPEGYNEFIKTLPVEINYVKNKGKFVYIKFKNGWYMWCTFGLTGFMVIYNLCYI